MAWVHIGEKLNTDDQKGLGCPQGICRGQSRTWGQPRRPLVQQTGAFVGKLQSSCSSELQCCQTDFFGSTVAQNYLLNSKVIFKNTFYFKATHTYPGALNCRESMLVQSTYPWPCLHLSLSHSTEKSTLRQASPSRGPFAPLMPHKDDMSLEMSESSGFLHVNKYSCELFITFFLSSENVIEKLVALIPYPNNRRVDSLFSQIAAWISQQLTFQTGSWSVVKIEPKLKIIN